MNRYAKVIRGCKGYTANINAQRHKLNEYLRSGSIRKNIWRLFTRLNRPHMSDYALKRTENSNRYLELVARYGRWLFVQRYSAQTRYIYQKAVKKFITVQ